MGWRRAPLGWGALCKRTYKFSADVPTYKRIGLHVKRPSGTLLPDGFHKLAGVKLIRAFVPWLLRITRLIFTFFFVFRFFAQIQSEFFAVLVDLRRMSSRTVLFRPVVSSCHRRSPPGYKMFPVRKGTPLVSLQAPITCDIRMAASFRERDNPVY